jgi:hypothetical protein
MISCVWLVFFGFVVGVESAGEIMIQNQPSSVMWCGQSFVLNFSYSGTVTAGTELKVQLMFDVSDLARNKEIALLGTVVAPETQFAINLASPFPAQWLGDQKLSNDGLQQQVLFRVSKVADDKFNSDCSSTFCRDPSFAMICCPSANTAKCGCESCSCANNDVCSNGLECHYTTPRGVCQVPLPGLGEKCPLGKCAGNFVCQCPTGSSCLASEQMCNDNRCATPMVGVPSRLNCRCSPGDMLCESGTTCLLNYCRVSNDVPIGSLACEPSLSVKAKDVCMLHKDGSAPRPYSCQNKKCTICEPGSRLCVCKSPACLNPDDICEGGRCFPRLGCVGCLCNPDSSCNDAEAMCLSDTCKFMTPIAPSSSPTLLNRYCRRRQWYFGVSVYDARQPLVSEPLVARDVLVCSAE